MEQLRQPKRLVQPSGWQIPSLLIWLVAALGVPYQFMLQSTPNVMIGKLVGVLHTSESGVGFLTSTFFYTYLLFQVPAGILIDRFGVRNVLSASVALAGFACLLFASSHLLLAATATRLLMGLVTSPCVPAIMSVACKRFSPKMFVILAGLAESIGMLGGAFGEGILGSVVTEFGWRSTMSGCGLLGFALALLMFCVIRDTPKQLVVTPKSELRTILTGFAEVMRNSQVWLIVLWGGLVFALLPALAGLWIVQAMQDLYRLPLNEAALGSSVIFFGTALGLPFWGWLSERLGRQRRVMFIATSLSFVFTASFVYGRGLPLLVVYLQLMLMGFVSAVYVLAFALVRERTQPQVSASAMGLTNMMSMLIGAPLLQPLIGAVLSHYGSVVVGMSPQRAVMAYHAALAGVVLCLAFALVLIFFIRETCSRQQS